eukprot:TRINITY_DN5587_c0_g1_i1.p1 TRINITY_DN5587_c0_g1~~TRINITY_DN5587_c0_g1_i1.p1  ORF type:complete len:1056 (-),score=329.56 TRINITY_DN5587_c0_g1_i1:52-2829(-)
MNVVELNVFTEPYFTNQIEGMEGSNTKVDPRKLAHHLFQFDKSADVNQVLTTITSYFETDADGDRVLDEIVLKENNTKLTFCNVIPYDTKTLSLSLLSRLRNNDGSVLLNPDSDSTVDGNNTKGGNITNNNESWKTMTLESLNLAGKVVDILYWDGSNVNESIVTRNSFVSTGANLTGANIPVHLQKRSHNTAPIRPKMVQICNNIDFEIYVFNSTTNQWENHSKISNVNHKNVLGDLKLEFEQLTKIKDDQQLIYLLPPPNFLDSNPDSLPPPILIPNNQNLTFFDILQLTDPHWIPPQQPVITLKITIEDNIQYKNSNMKSKAMNSYSNYEYPFFSADAKSKKQLQIFAIDRATDDNLDTVVSCFAFPNTSLLALKLLIIQELGSPPLALRLNNSTTEWDYRKLLLKTQDGKILNDVNVNEEMTTIEQCKIAEGQKLIIEPDKTKIELVKLIFFFALQTDQGKIISKWSVGKKMTKDPIEVWLPIGVSLKTAKKEMLRAVGIEATAKTLATEDDKYPGGKSYRLRRTEGAWNDAGKIIDDVDESTIKIGDNVKENEENWWLEEGVVPNKGVVCVEVKLFVKTNTETTSKEEEQEQDVLQNVRDELASVGVQLNRKKWDLLPWELVSLTTEEGIVIDRNGDAVNEGDITLGESSLEMRDGWTAERVKQELLSTVLKLYGIESIHNLRLWSETGVLLDHPKDATTLAKMVREVSGGRKGEQNTNGVRTMTLIVENHPNTDVQILNATTPQESGSEVLVFVQYKLQGTRLKFERSKQRSMWVEGAITAEEFLERVKQVLDITGEIKVAKYVAWTDGWKEVERIGKGMKGKPWNMRSGDEFVAWSGEGNWMEEWSEEKERVKVKGEGEKEGKRRNVRKETRDKQREKERIKRRGEQGARVRVREQELKIEVDDFEGALAKLHKKEKK